MKRLFDTLSMLVGGAFFGFGLAYAGMISPEVVLRFLTLQDFGLTLVMIGAIAVTLLVYQVAPRWLRQPLLGGQFEKRSRPLNRQMLFGAAIFGVGWGLSGVCPGPAIAGLGSGNLKLLWSVAGIFVGAYVQGWWSDRTHR